MYKEQEMDLVDEFEIDEELLSSPDFLSDTVIQKINRCKMQLGLRVQNLVAFYLYIKESYF